MPSFRGADLAFLRIIERDADGAAIPGGNTFTTCCDIDSIEWENDQEDASNVDVPNASYDCRVRFRRPAIKYGKIVRIGTVGTVPEIANILTGAPLNEDGGDIIGARDTDYECKFVSVEFAVKSLSAACVAGAGGRLWRNFFKVGQWAITQDESYTNSNEVPVTIYEGYGEKNANFDDPYGIWTGSPSLWDADSYDSYAVLDEALPTCSPDFTITPS
jgi:hypothetical protein